MEAVFADIGAAFLLYAVEARHDGSPLSGLDRGSECANRPGITAKDTEEVSEDAVSSSNAAWKSFEPASGTHRPYIVRISASKNMKFTADDLFRNDDAMSLKEQYLHWREFRDQNLALSTPPGQMAVLSRFVAVAKHLDDSQDEIGSIPLEMAYSLLYTHYQQLRSTHKMTSPQSNSLYDIILRKRYGEEWAVMKENVRQRKSEKLQRQVLIGRRWLFTVNALSQGTILLAGKIIPTIM